MEAVYILLVSDSCLLVVKQGLVLLNKSGFLFNYSFAKTSSRLIL